MKNAHFCQIFRINSTSELYNDLCGVFFFGFLISVQYTCHSGWPFCTWLGLATGLVGWLPSRLLRHARRGSLAGRLTLIWWLSPLQMRVDTVLYPHACVVSPPKWPYIRRHIGLSQSVRVWQAVRVWQSVSPDSRVAHSPRPSWDFRLGQCLVRCPLQVESALS